MPEDFTWRVHYDDGTTHDEHDADGVGRPFASIDLRRVTALELVPQHDAVRSYVVRCVNGVRPILFRRRRVEIVPTDGGAVNHATITCLGYQKTERGRNVQAFLFLFSDGSAVLTDDRDAVQ